MAVIRARRFQARLPIVDEQGRPTADFLANINQVVDIANALALANAAALAAQNAADAAQFAADAAQSAADNAQSTGNNASAEQSLQGSYPSGFTPPLITADALGNVTVAAHSRVYGSTTLNPTVSVNGDTFVSGYAPGEVIRIYYDDPSRAGGAVAYMETDDPAVAVQTGDRHSVGAVKIPLSGSNDGQYLKPPGYVEV